MIFKLIGIIGLLLIIRGVSVNNKKQQSQIFIYGGLCLTAYSIYIHDLIFTILQLIFVIAAFKNLGKK